MMIFRFEEMSSRAYRIGIFLSIIGVINIAIAVAIHQFAAQERERAETVLASVGTASAPPVPSSTASAVLEPVPANGEPLEGDAPDRASPAPTSTPTSNNPPPAASVAKSAQVPKEFDWHKVVDACEQCNAKACFDLADRHARGGPDRAAMPYMARAIAKRACTECGGASNPATASRCAAWGFSETQE